MYREMGGAIQQGQGKVGQARLALRAGPKLSRQNTAKRPGLAASAWGCSRGQAIHVVGDA